MSGSTSIVSLPSFVSILIFVATNILPGSVSEAILGLTGEGELLEANLSQLGAGYQINIRTFVRAIFQYSDLSRDTVLYTARQVEPEDEELFTQLLFSYKLNPQTVLFLGYSDNQHGGTIEGDTIRLTRTDRTLFFKVGYALVM